MALTRAVNSHDSLILNMCLLCFFFIVSLKYHISEQNLALTRAVNSDVKYALNLEHLCTIHSVMYFSYWYVNIIDLYSYLSIVFL